jgi:hydroxyacylglutathione hydrolase
VTAARARPSPATTPPRRPPSVPPLPQVDGFEISRLPLDPSLDLTAWAAPELGNCSYVLSFPQTGTAVVVDPVLDLDGYLPFLRALSPRRVLALETHVHNDFLSGAHALAKAIGAEAVVGAGAPVTFAHRGVRDGDALELGDWRIVALDSPGHTPEHVSFLLRDASDRPRAVFSGGALIIGSAARTDLFGPAMARPLAHQLYLTVREKFLPLPGTVQLLPTHGGGSFCAAATDGKRQGTLASERAHNPLLRARSEEEFVSWILEQGPYPTYFHRMRALNLAEAAPAKEEAPHPRALALDRFDRLRAQGAMVIDTRRPVDFDDGHVPGSLSVGEDGPLSAWVGWLLPDDRPLLLVSENEREAGAATRQLYRIGYDKVEGFLAGGFPAWKDEGRAISKRQRMEVDELRRVLAAAGPGIVLDVRETHEWFSGHIPGSVNIPVSEIAARGRELPRDVPIYVHCAHGYRASVASSLLERAGFDRLVRVSGGYEEWAAQRAGPTTPH